jgi:hypothetical protein
VIQNMNTTTTTQVQPIHHLFLTPVPNTPSTPPIPQAAVRPPPNHDHPHCHHPHQNPDHLPLVNHRHHHLQLVHRLVNPAASAFRPQAALVHHPHFHPQLVNQGRHRFHHQPANPPAHPPLPRNQDRHLQAKVQAQAYQPLKVDHHQLLNPPALASRFLPVPLNQDQLVYPRH